MKLRLWPGSLFGRLALLLVGVLAIALVATILLFRQDRANLLLRHVSETRLVQLQGLRNALDALPSNVDRETLQQIARRNGVRIIAPDERAPGGFNSRGFRPGRRGPPDGFRDRPPASMAGPEDPGERSVDAPGSTIDPFLPVLEQLEARLVDAFGPGVEVRVQPRAQLLWVRLPTSATAYWVGLPLPPRPAPDEPSRAIAISMTLAAALVIAAFLFARYLARPLRELAAAVASVGRGGQPKPLPTSGPSEIAALNRGFNTMLANLEQNERDRAVLLAGVSHDLRTPLARLRLGVELSAADAEMRAGMIADIEEMDRVIGQFLDFARGEDSTRVEPTELDPLLQDATQRYRDLGRDVRFSAGGTGELPLRRTAISRMVANLVDNAVAYGTPPVEVATRNEGGAVLIEVADRGPGIPPGQVERLKQPFTRADDARTRADGAPGAGLGLAIVERIARLHGGRFDILAREGGGTLARITLPRLAPQPAL